MDPSPAPPISSATKVLSIHELVRLIASFNTTIDRMPFAKAYVIDRKDLVRFSQVCRQTFETLTPAIWESVNGAENLLKLIESASSVHNCATGKLQNMSLPGQLTNRTFERFDFYAPCVKNLNVYGKNCIAFGVQGWPTLVSRSHGRPLLPHLKSILFFRNPSPGYEHDEARWISCFATNVTIEVMTVFKKWGPGLFPYAAASNLLETLTKHCPNVETLALHPRDFNEDFAPGSSMIISHSISSNPWYQHLQSLPNLHHLSISEGWLCPASLHALGRIPGLKSLDISPGNCKGFDLIDDLDPNLDLSPGAFATLDMLLLSDNCPLTTAKILGIQGMVRHITNLYIELGPEWDDEEGSGKVSGSGADLILLLHNTPNLRRLAIDFHSTVASNVYPIQVPEALDIMAELRLQTVNLPNLHLGQSVLGVNFGMVWENVTRLSMPHQYASIHELWYFATMPHLRRLTLMLDLTLTYTPANISCLPRAPLHTLEASLGSRASFDWKVISYNAEKIAQFWPCTHFIGQATQPQVENGVECWDVFVSRFDHLTSAYSVLHATDSQEDEEQARRVLKEIEVGWRHQTEGIFDPDQEYVYGGSGVAFDYKE